MTDSEKEVYFVIQTSIAKPSCGELGPVVQN